MKKVGAATVGACVLAGALVSGCASEHSSAVPATGELACEPEALRSAWWSDGAGPFYGGTGEIVLDPSGTHVLIEDTFRATSVRLSDGVRSEGSVPTVELAEVRGIRFATPRMATDAAGRSDYAGATDVLAIGDPTPLATIPWIVPRDADGTTQVVAHVGQTSGRAVLVERAFAFGGAERGTWLRSMDLGDLAAEQRVDLAATVAPVDLSFEAAFTLVVDEGSGVAFVSNAPQTSAPRIVRVDPDTGAIATTTLALGAPAPLLGTPFVGEPGTQLLDVALAGDGTTLYATTRDGRLHVLDATTLEALEGARTVGVVVANEDTYLPSLRSPVAATEHGTFVAEVGSDGRIEIVDARTGAVRTTLASVAHPTDVDGHPTFPRAMHLRFLPDGLLVVSDVGVERFRCE